MLKGVKQFISARKKAERLDKSDMEQANAIHDVYKKHGKKLNSNMKVNNPHQQHQHQLNIQWLNIQIVLATIKIR